MTGMAFAAHEASMDVLWAQEMLESRRGNLSQEQTRILTLMATCGDVKEAERASLDVLRREQMRAAGFEGMANAG
jgi:hypothetical protein